MWRLLAILGTIVFLAALWQFRGGPTAQHLQTRLLDPTVNGGAVARPIVISPTAPVSLDLQKSRSVEILLDTLGWQISGWLTIEGKGTGKLFVEDGQVREIGPDTANCLHSAGDVWTCDLFVKTRRYDRELLLVYAAGGLTELLHVDFKSTSAKRLTGATPDGLLAGFALLLLIGPALVLVARRWPDLELVLLAGLGVAWLAFSGLYCLLTVLVFLVIGRVILLFVWYTRRLRFSTLSIAVLLIAIMLGFVKFGIPFAAQGFASPGGYVFGLPLGISYLAVRSLDLIVAAHAGRPPPPNRSYVAFMLFPATLPAGPIATFEQFERSRISNWNIADYAAGVARCGVGIVKMLAAQSVLIPHILGPSERFSIKPWDMASADVALMLVCVLAYVYLDFSAYADLSIGCARAMGRSVPENFNFPLLSRNIRIFWQSWHITLSSWAMRRVYMPAFLTGHSPFLALFATMLAIGMWHMPTLTWVLWAFHHSVALMVVMRLNKLKVSVFVDERFSRALHTIAWPLGCAATIYWVALGHALVLYTDPKLSIDLYIRGLCAPWKMLIWCF
jgi:alginate O-acetyltransferase complex protein AlgI